MVKARRLVCCSLAIAAIMGLAACSQATEAATTDNGVTNATVFATVGGKVVGPDGKGLSDVVISFQTGASSKDIGSFTTGSDGMFELTGLISGKHTIFIGNGVTSTQLAIEVEVPDLAALTAAATISVTDVATEAEIPATSIIKQYDGHYFVNIELNPSGQDLFLLYPCTATLTGTAMVKDRAAQNDSAAVAASAGTKVLANFKDWNGDSDLLFQGKVSGTAGEFSISNVPAIFDSFADGSLILFLVAEDGATTALDSYTIDGTSSNISGEASVSDGATLPGDSRDLGVLYFVEGAAPNILSFDPLPVTSSNTKDNVDSNATFDPGIGASPTAISFTFDRAMNTAKGSATAKNGTAATYTCVAVWDTATPANPKLTLTPDRSFELGKTITVVLSDYESADGAAFGGTYTYKVREAFAIVSSNIYKPYQAASYVQEVPIATVLSVVFNYPISWLDPTKTYLVESATATDTTPIVTAAFAIGADAKELSGTPGSVATPVSLKYNASYTLHFGLSASVAQARDEVTAGTITFKTAPNNMTLSTPTLTFDDYAKITASSRTAYEFGESTAYVKFTTVAGADSYAYQYRYSSGSSWIDGGAITPTQYETISSTEYAYAALSITNAAIYPGKSVEVRVIAKETVLGTAIAVSAPCSFTDTVHPTVAVGSYTSGAFANATTSAKIVKVTIATTTPTNEPFSEPNSSQFGFVTATSNASIVSVATNADNTNIFVWVRIEASVGAAVQSNTLRAHLFDAAGNYYDQAGSSGLTNGQFDIALGG